MLITQLNKLGIVKIYNRTDILLVPFKSSLLSALSPCKKRFNIMLLSFLIVLFENVLSNISFFKKNICFQQSDKKELGFFSVLLIIIKRFFLSFWRKPATSKLVKKEKY